MDLASCRHGQGTPGLAIAPHVDVEREHGFQFQGGPVAWLSQLERAHRDAVAQKSPESGDEAMAQLMQAYWVAFATGGVPGPPDKPQWPRFAKPGELQMIFDGRGARVEAAGSPVLDSIEAAATAAAASAHFATLTFYRASPGGAASAAPAP